MRPSGTMPRAAAPRRLAYCTLHAIKEVRVSDQSSAVSADRALTLEIVTPDGPVWHGQAGSVSLPSISGSMSIRPRHEPTAAVLGSGSILVRPADAPVFHLHISGGYRS
ncbi:hypothetical protein [Cellulomonas endometrii]|uniref:hypothetical protein n=1 Tax=Cellulomonas endometrii TaxID=3036301 RepID=UPI003D15788A